MKIKPKTQIPPVVMNKKKSPPPKKKSSKFFQMQPVNAITFSEGGLQSTVSLGDRQHGGHRASVAGHMCEYSKKNKGKEL